MAYEPNAKKRHVKHAIRMLTASLIGNRIISTSESFDIDLKKGGKVTATIVVKMHLPGNWQKAKRTKRK